ncbi:MAG: aspartate aminotransferase family protein [Clostridia bacterium]|nr:aspartate aminotransferase family protein [Clostridia bacterium]
MNTSVFERYESEVRSYCRSFPTVFSKAKGSTLTDSEGRNYIDFFCGAGALNYGHNNDYIKRKVIEYMEADGVVHALDMYTEAKSDFIDFFQDKVLIPRGFDYKIQFPGPTGTNAVEAALKLARKVKHRSGVFALMGAFHGMTLGALALTTDAGSRGGAGVSLGDVTHVPAPYMFKGLDVIDYMQTLLDDDHSGVDKPAALVIETVQAEGGIYVFENEFLKGAEEFCRKNDILLIVDDIQVGCARTGTYFSFERAGIVPDMVILSKSIGGYGMPFSLVLLKPELDAWSPGEHNGTFRGYQPSIVAAKAGLEVMLNEKIEERVAHLGELFADFMEKEIKPLDPRLEIRGIGCIWGVDFAALGDDISAKVMRKCFADGLIVERVGRKNSVVKLMPPLVIGEEELLEGLKILKNAIVACI